MPSQTHTSYTINVHPEPEKVYEWVRHNWHDLNQHSVDEVIDTLQKFAKAHDLTLDYAISAVPDRGEYIRFRGAEPDFAVDEKTLHADCPYTGVYFDDVILQLFRANNTIDTLADIEQAILSCIHDETEYQYSDDGLRELCEANEYFFFRSGVQAHD